MAQVLFRQQLKDVAGDSWAYQWIDQDQYKKIPIARYSNSLDGSCGVPPKQWHELRQWLIHNLRGEIIIYEGGHERLGQGKLVYLWFSDEEDASYFMLSKWGSQVIEVDTDK